MDDRSVFFYSNVDTLMKTIILILRALVKNTLKAREKRPRIPPGESCYYSVRENPTGNGQTENVNVRFTRRSRVIPPRRVQPGAVWCDYNIISCREDNKRFRTRDGRARRDVMYWPRYAFGDNGDRLQFFFFVFQ